MLKKYRVNVNGQAYDVTVEELNAGAAPAAPAAPVAVSAPAALPSAPVSPAPAVAAGGAGTIKAPMPGTILAVKVSNGQQVKTGDVLLILEAMKMENEICATGNGIVTQVRVQTGTTVNTGDPLIDLA